MFVAGCLVTHIEELAPLITAAGKDLVTKGSFYFIAPILWFVLKRKVAW